MPKILEKMSLKICAPAYRIIIIMEILVVYNVLIIVQIAKVIPNVLVVKIICKGLGKMIQVIFVPA